MSICFTNTDISIASLSPFLSFSLSYFFILSFHSFKREYVYWKTREYDLIRIYRKQSDWNLLEVIPK